jgi:hypothetical protein
VVVFVTNHQDTGAPAYRLERVKQSLYGCPGRANVKPKCRDISITGGNLAHKSPGNLTKIIRPLVHHLGAGRDYDNPIDFTAGEEILRDRARRKGLSGPRRSVNEEMAVTPILDKPMDSLLKGIPLPWPKT